MTNECARVLKLKTKFYWFIHNMYYTCLYVYLYITFHIVTHCHWDFCVCMCVYMISSEMSAKHCSKLSKYLINRWLFWKGFEVVELIRFQYVNEYTHHTNHLHSRHCIFNSINLLMQRNWKVETVLMNQSLFNSNNNNYN